MYNPEGTASQETSSCLCFLLCEENSCTLGHILLLLHSYTSLCDSSWSQSQKADCHIHPSNHYNSKCSLHPKVTGPDYNNSVKFIQFLSECIYLCSIKSLSLSYPNYSTSTYTWDRSGYSLRMSCPSIELKQQLLDSWKQIVSMNGLWLRSLEMPWNRERMLGHQELHGSEL